ncbi:hypothetical protein OG788_40705 [Streptomyces sp. NBC_00647]|uniref:hypothetical protein n=1 Tax=Streptomyces sp. NBC_00647 TaxID=2975796 RepID=UPI00324A891A
MRARHLAPALAFATTALLLTACGGPTEKADAPSSPTSTSTDLAHLRELVDDAESAASSAESDMAQD